MKVKTTIFTNTLWEIVTPISLNKFLQNKKKAEDSNQLLKINGIQSSTEALKGVSRYINTTFYLDLNETNFLGYKEEKLWDEIKSYATLAIEKAGYNLAELAELKRIARPESVDDKMRTRSLDVILDTVNRERDLSKEEYTKVVLEYVESLNKDLKKKELEKREAELNEQLKILESN